MPKAAGSSLQPIADLVEPRARAAVVELRPRRSGRADRADDLVAELAEVPYFRSRMVCAKCGSRGNKIDVRSNRKEQPPSESLTGKQWR